MSYSASIGDASARMTPPDRPLAEALQRVLLPPGLPDVRGWGMATLYEPAGEGVLVGGDFYDWFTLPNGNVLFFIGDVSGKGPVAGALGMSIRKALKGISWVVGDPAVALPLLEQALQDEFADSFATLCLVEVTPRSGDVRIVLAGHPPPWVSQGGTFSEVRSPTNVPIGLGLDNKWEDVVVSLAPGDKLVLFSDGLSEARMPDGRLFGEGHLERFLGSLPDGLSSYETVLQADAHLRRVARSLNDDMVIAVLSYASPRAAGARGADSGEVLSLMLSPQAASVSLARRFTTDACSRWQLDASAIAAAELITSELVTNAVLHARTDIDVMLRLEVGELKVGVRDRSTDLPRSSSETPDEAAADHGRGLRLVRTLASRTWVDRTDDGKVVWAAIGR